MSVVARPIPLGTPDRRLFGVIYAPEAEPLGSVLICPPLFHEHFLSYRLLSSIAARLAELRLLCLRFDYFGSGDSYGADADFTLAGAATDTRIALEALRAEAGDVPVVVIGARAGAWPALAAIGTAAVDRICLWQPLADGAAWLRALLARDAEERASRQRYPFLRVATHAAEPHQLLGYRVDQRLRDEISAQSLQPPASIPFDVVADPNATDGSAVYGRRFDLPASLVGWEEETIIRNALPGRDIASLAKTLAAAWTQKAHS